MDAKIVKRFWSKVNREGPTPEHRPELGPCWVWTGARTHNGYGHMYYATHSGKQTQRRAHRVSWEIANGPVPAGLCVLHRCDNPACVRPSHLFLGTYADNIHDAISKERHAAGPRHGSRTKPESIRRGEQGPKAKLTGGGVLEIRRRAGDGDTHAAIAADFGVDRSTVSMIVRRERWSHL